jgi:hypothetical protein
MKYLNIWLAIILFSSITLVKGQEESAPNLSNYIKMDISHRSSGISFFGLSEKQNVSLGLGYYSSFIDTVGTSVRNNSYKLNSFPIQLAIHKNLFQKKLHFRAEAGVHLFGSNRYDINTYYHVSSELLFTKDFFFLGVGLKKPFSVSTAHNIIDKPFVQLALGVNF